MLSNLQHWFPMRKTPFLRPVSHVLTELLHLGTSGAPQNQGQGYDRLNGQCPRVESQSVPSIWTSLSSYNTGEPIRTVVVNHEPTCVRFRFSLESGDLWELSLWMTIVSRDSLNISVHHTTGQMQLPGRGESLKNCTGNRKWDLSAQPAFCGSFASTSTWPLGPALLVV